ncbi:MAG: TIGR01212 family radical SAM protein [Lachnospiraceae bacterium]|nr:TIGR01212 family radical SAM protein [Lachnospiraceae bacterium]
MEYRSLSDYLKAEYGEKIYKLSLQTGCTCPNRDGTKGSGGCIFCSEGGSGDFAAKLRPIDEQIEEAKKRVESKMGKRKDGRPARYIAYFQSFTNTYGDTDRLLALFEEALRRPDIVGLSIGTRPDCITEEMLAGLAELNRQKPVWVELGLQTIHEETARLIHRCYELSVFEETYSRLKKAGLTVIVHLILGLPGETEEMMLQSVDYLAKLNPPLDGVKLQLLHILKGTKLEDYYREQPFHVLTLKEYTELIVQCLRHLPENIVIHRLTGDGPKKLLIEPQWSADKKRVLNTIANAVKEAERTV